MLRVRADMAKGVCKRCLGNEIGPAVKTIWLKEYILYMLRVAIYRCQSELYACFHGYILVDDIYIYIDI